MKKCYLAMPMVYYTNAFMPQDAHMSPEEGAAFLTFKNALIAHFEKTAHETFNDTLEIINPRDLQEAFLAWTAASPQNATNPMAFFLQHTTQADCAVGVLLKDPDHKSYYIPCGVDIETFDVYKRDKPVIYITPHILSINAECVSAVHKMGTESFKMFTRQTITETEASLYQLQNELYQLFLTGKNYT